MAGRVKEWCFRLLLLLLSVVLPLLLVEFVLVLDNARPDARQFTRVFELNGRPYSLIEAPDVLQDASNAVLIAGDSFTAGAACSDQRTYPSAFTAAAKQQRLPLNGVNLGVPGTGPMAYLERARDYIAHHGRARGVVLTLYANDVEIDCFACQHLREWAEAAHASEAEIEQLKQLCSACVGNQSIRAASEVAGDVSVVRRLNWWLADHSLAYLAFREGAAKLAAAAGALPSTWGRGAYAQRWSDVNGLHFKYLRGVIALAGRDAARHGIPTLVVIYPDSMNITRDNPFAGIYERASRELTDLTGVKVMSGYAGFLADSRTTRDMPFSFSDTHPNCDANRIFGEWVLKTWLAHNG